ncbi:hypothetical protein H112_03848 [Trichophyton rubrum D6]|uniref:Kazal-like domain-containing protein n=2 Tax=Trichophyton TaxID=5550 RepID=A0A022W434_TRIRU|nr:hypothetical protein H100_03857 [Trichophyton rubrum MR850]EZF42558.1 hypothetical protein H102_03843 [Trichophyton rubrum CBS 100081]EZF53175.1 hypothetical protein H103_03858 [Trichophyton rubrum CBS 288.86]EZF63843.1 hypothetical protein H104_03843 [Trichophyton rubrum CBS 289.86]EZF74163.1 hypothetical protein H105_03871 [Trichophyton soudanense CBS 452.61]EZF85122.1 hypothetical protein H110_03849 [Trichophyton rubrum MR1448]EZF95768.1 hypothetical protein H113_03881 [Trichophyton rub
MKVQYLLTFMTIGLSMAHSGRHMKRNDGCSTICTAEFKPVCGQGSDGTSKTFSNLCQLKAANCDKSSSSFVLLREGEC